MSVPKEILICGGGTAGWMTANLMQHHWPTSNIRLVESPNVGIIGVGEGSTPYLKQFFNTLGIAESEWMPECNATYKVGIRFPNWSTRADYDSYFHPFFSELDIKPGEPFFYNAKLQKQGVDAGAHPDHYFVTAEMARQCSAPVSHKYKELDIDYGYHFDSGLLGEFLKRRAISRGLIHLQDDIESVETNANSDTVGGDQILAVNCQSLGALTADLYVDCTGFNSLLMQKALHEPFHDYRENLFNNAAVAIATPIDDSKPIPVETESTALSCGWAWRIPLANRFGNGYVYSTEYLSPEEAESELKAHLGLAPDAEVEARHLTMKVGQIKRHLRGNCLAVGLSQGFIEPLEATALMLVQYTIEQFIAAQNKQSSEQAYNAKINNMMAGIRDYIVCHYYTNSRTDSQYWRDCRDKLVLTPNLQKLLAAWSDNSEFEQVLIELEPELVYLRPSWYVMLMGVGYFPKTLENKAPADRPVFNYQQAKAYCEKLVGDFFPSQDEYLQSLYGEKWPR